MVWMDKQNKYFLNKKGQSMVEYILLLSVIMTIGVAIFRSDFFQNLWGPDSEVFRRLKENLTFSYRHGLGGENDRTENNYSGKHETYFDGSETRFFLPTDAYPK